MNHFRPESPYSLPPVVKNIIILNVLFYIASLVFFFSFNFRLEEVLGLHVPTAQEFKPWQLVSYMFMHSYFSGGTIDIFHLFFNMYALFMFGKMLEMVWGPKRFLIYYFVTGIGAALIHLATQYIEIMPVVNAITNYMNHPSSESLELLMSKHIHLGSMEMKDKLDLFVGQYNSLINSNPQSAIALSKEYLNNYQMDYLNSFITIGASGSVFGVLLAFGMLFPNTELMLLIPPMPIKAKYFVMIYGAIELFLGIAGSSMDNVAHWAHLGGMLFGYFLIIHWKKDRTSFY